MQVDPKTLLFEDLDDETAAEIESAVDKIVFSGELPSPRPAWLSQWLEAAGFTDDRQYLLSVSALFPVRAYCSLYRWEKARKSTS